MDERRLVLCKTSCMPDDYVLDDMYAVLEDIEGARPGEWEQPEVELARLVYV